MSGGDSEEDTPVPMPNTAVKLFCANGSWGLPPARVGRCQAITVNALALGAEEGRDERRNASWSCK